MANVNVKQTIIKLPKPTYYHCFKLNDSNYALFDIKIDMPIVIGSIAIIKSTKLPLNSLVFYYEIGSLGFFTKGPEKYMKMDDNANGKHQKPPLKQTYIPNDLFYHHFKLSDTESALFCESFKNPVRYGSNDKIQVVINNINKDAKIFYYREDVSIKNSFKLWDMYPK